MTRGQLNRVGGDVLTACIEVHRHLGPGLLESAYVWALRRELELKNIKAETEIRLPLFYKGHDTGKEYRIDLLVEDEIIVEAKAVEVIYPAHVAQVISLLRLADKRLGYLVNFNVPRLIDGFSRYVNKF